VKPWESPYAGFANNPIWFTDPSGLDTTTTVSTPGKAVNGQVLTRTDAHGNEWYWIYEDGTGWIPQEGYGTLSTVVITADKATDQGEKKIEEQEEKKITQWDLFLIGLDVVDRAVQGNAMWNFGTSMHGKGQTGNPLAAKAAPGAKLLEFDEDILALQAKQKYTNGKGRNPYAPPSYRSRLNDQRINGKVGNRWDDKTMSKTREIDKQGPVLQVQTAEGVISNVNASTTTSAPVVLTGEYQAQDMQGNVYTKQVYSDGSVNFKMGSIYGIKEISDPGDLDWKPM
jgi:hypothetical protein